ncbi:phosphopantetheinyl transferase [Mucilaginibacter yixingensis]|uniref:Phosphopantetheinyl transferase n=1 Tax=Mucilaginibacter yixingensis TaxID=1295612 RepID=A0A2T5JER8_9SPHI|nr:4'-phosphopantetheinyl transferase superfamily protein [Mucilaginibacter yixingensis]PTR00940.1 phosphopantetheinyl transferase [Mucilaginibacter yixingensis]
MGQGTVTCSFNTKPVWNAFSAGPGIAAGIHLWHGNVADFAGMQQQFHALLSPAEQQAAARFYRQADRDRYIIQHGLLVVLLRWYLEDAELKPSYIYNPNKKPFLSNRFDCYFNLSNTGDEFLIAVGDSAMGIDIERVNPNFAYADVASYYFGSEELEYINQSADPHQAFFLLWTRKESLLKACGSGIDDNLPQIPALDGTHDLPAYFDSANWVTDSFMADSGAMVSVTHVLPGNGMNLWQINADSI